MQHALTPVTVVTAARGRLRGIPGVVGGNASVRDGFHVPGYAPLGGKGHLVSLVAPVAKPVLGGDGGVFLEPVVAVHRRGRHVRSRRRQAPRFGGVRVKGLHLVILVRAQRAGTDVGVLG